MANIQEYLQRIKSAIYGREVRSSIHDAIEAINDEVSDFVHGDLDTTLTSEVLPAQGKAVGDAIDALSERIDGVTVEIDGANIEDGTIPRTAVDSDFEATLAKADTAVQPTSAVQEALIKAGTAMQPTVYDPNGYGTGNNPVDPYTFAQNEVGPVSSRVTSIGNEILGAYSVYSDESQEDITTYNSLGDAVRGAYAKAKEYADSLVDGQGSSTVIVTELPAVGDPNIDYILASNGEYKYYKYIDNDWRLIAGSNASLIVSNTPIHAVDDGSPSDNDLDPEDYVIVGGTVGYLDRTTMNVYVPVLVGNDSYEWNNTGSLISTPSTTKDYYVYYDEKDIYLHFRYVGSYFKRVGNDTYSRDEIDNIVATSTAGLSAAIATNQTNIASQGDSILSISSALENLRQTVNNLDVEGVTYYATYGNAEIGGVNTENVFTLYEVDGEDETVVSQFVITGGGGGGGGGQTTTLVVERITSSPLIITTTDPANISYTYSSLDGDGQEVDGTYTWKLNGTVISSGACIHGTNTFDATNYCSVGTQKFTLTITDEGGSTVVKTWTVQKVDVRLESSFNDRITYNAGSAVNFTYTPYGSVNKTVHFILDGVELNTITTLASGTLQSYSIPAQPHGAHLLECYLTAVINGSQIETVHIFKDIIWYDSESTVPVIGCIYRCLPVAQNAVYDEDTKYYYLDDGFYTLYEGGSEGWDSRPQLYYQAVKANQYDTTNLPYVVYNPATGAPTVIQNVDGREISVTLDGYSGSLAYKTSEAGTHTITLTCGVTSIGIIMDILELDIDVTPVTANLAFDFNPTGRSNSSANRMWVDDNNPSVALSVSSNFDWANGGYQTDTNGNQYFCVKAGTTATFSYALFGQNPYSTGSHFKLIFKTDNIRDIETTWMSCVADSVGLEMKAHNANLKTSSNTLFAPYSEGDIIEFEYNIDTLDTEDVNADSLIMIYEDGVAYRPLIYDTTHRLHQYDPVYITFGSRDCDVMIYRMKAWTASLTDSNTISNFIADSVSSEEMVARYNRNQIYNANNLLTPESIAAACPWLKVIKIDAPKFTNNKSEKISNTTIQCIHTGGDPVLDNWTARNAKHSGQGTTSNEYGVAGRNMDLIMNGDDTILILGDGTTYTGGSGKVTLTRTSIPNNYFNVKVNIASSENANNALLANRYDRFLPYSTPAKLKNPNTKTTMEFVNCAIFIRENDEDISTHREFNDTNWHFYAIGNIGDSKKTDKTRVNDSSDVKEFVNEILDNTLANSVFDTGVVNLIVESLPTTGDRFTDYYRKNSNGTYTLSRYLSNGWVTVSTNVETIQNGAVSIVSSLPDTGAINIEYYVGSAGNYTMYTWNGTTWSTGASRTEIENSHMANSISPQQWIAGNVKYDSLYAPESDGKFGTATYEFRYEHKNVSSEQHLANMQLWRDMYGWVITSTDQEFVSQFEDWFVKDAALYYYLFTERYTMTDNRAKNSFWHWSKFYISESEAAGDYADVAEYYTVDNARAAIHDGYRFDFWDYDNDTALGINNSGEMKMPYGKEDIDYQEDRNPASGYVYNGAESVFFRRIRLLLHSDLVSLYQELESLGAWTSTTFISEFDAWQEQFPEELWRLDIERKYYRPYYGTSVDNSIPKSSSRFLGTMMNGRKKYHRRQFERDQSVYIGSKYLASSVRTDQIMFRCNTPQSAVVTPDYTLEIVPYSDMYLSVMFGNTVPYQVRAKAGETYRVECPLTTMDDTAILVYAASRIQALNDLSACYIHDNDFSNARKLQTLIIGSGITGYSNPFLTSLTLGNNALLATLDLRGCPNLTGSLNLSYCTNLLTLRADGTSVTGIIFANNGKITTAYLPDTVSSLTMRNLNNLADINAEFDVLESLVLEYGVLDSLALIQDTADTLRSLRLVGINWILPTTSLLNTILGMNSSYLSGSVYISGSIRLQELDDYTRAWPDLTVNYDPEGVVTQYLATYVNIDGTVLYTCYVDRGSLPPDPVDLGYIPTPTAEPTAQYYFYYDGWDDITSPTLTSRTITVHYLTTVRSYTVRWFSRAGLLLESTEVQYGDEAVYPGEIPENDSEESAYIYNIFYGWDKSTGFVRGDTDVYAVWGKSALPETGIELQDMTPEQIYAITKNGVADSYFVVGDNIDIQMGWDVNYSNVESELILQNTFFDGMDDYYDTSIKLFDRNSPSFTLAIDYELLTTNSNGATLIACFEEIGNEGFRVRSSNSYANLVWGDKNVNVSYRGNRNMLVLRHVQGENSLHYYIHTMGYERYEDTISFGTMIRTRSTISEQVLTFGATRYIDDGTHDYYGRGWIHWAKIWYDDLGEDVAKKLAQWPHQILPMYVTGFNRYRLAGQNNQRANLTLEMRNNLQLMFYMNNDHTNVGGWDASLGRRIVQRIYYALPYCWESCIKKVKIPTSAGNMSLDIVLSEDYIYLPSYIEMNGDSKISPYVDEGIETSFYTTNESRRKINNMIIPNTSQLYSRSSDPSASYTLNEGDIWFNTSTNYQYAYITPDTRSKHSKISNQYFTNNDSVDLPAADGGYWIRFGSYRTRSPVANNSSSFWNIGQYGTLSGSGAAYQYSISVSFSI